MQLVRLNYLIISALIIMSCNSKPSQIETKPVEINLRTDHISSAEIENLKFTDYMLSSDSKKAVLDWSKYQELNIQIGFLKTGDLSFFSGDKSTLKAFMYELKSGIPEGIDTEIIKSRLTALETKLLKFNSQLHLENNPKSEQLNVIKEFLVATANLNLQINKKLELDANNILKPE